MTRLPRHSAFASIKAALADPRTTADVALLCTSRAGCPSRLGSVPPNRHVDAGCATLSGGLELRLYLPVIADLLISSEDTPNSSRRSCYPVDSSGAPRMAVSGTERYPGVSFTSRYSHSVSTSRMA